MHGNRNLLAHFFISSGFFSFPSHWIWSTCLHHILPELAAGVARIHRRGQGTGKGRREEKIPYALRHLSPSYPSMTGCRHQYPPGIFNAPDCSFPYLGPLFPGRRSLSSPFRIIGIYTASMDSSISAVRQFIKYQGYQKFREDRFPFVTGCSAWVLLPARSFNVKIDGRYQSCSVFSRMRFAWNRLFGPFSWRSHWEPGSSGFLDAELPSLFSLLFPSVLVSFLFCLFPLSHRCLQHWCLKMPCWRGNFER